VNQESNQKSIYVRKIHPEGSVRAKRTANVPTSLSLSNPIKIDSKSRRFLFFRDYREWGSKTRIMVQKIDSSTGNFVRDPKAFTPFMSGPCSLCSLQSVAVAPRGNIVFYIDFDTSCSENILKAQIFSPKTDTKINLPQTLIGCDRIPGEGNGGWVWDGIYGIDVVQFEH
jgi:hypothetical protein